MGVAAPGVVTPGVADGHCGNTVVTVGVAAPTTAAEGTAVEEARLMEVVARDAVRRLDDVTGGVAAALGEAAVDEGTA